MLACRRPRTPELDLGGCRMGSHAEFARLVEAASGYGHAHIPRQPSAEVLTEPVFLQAGQHRRPGSRSRRGVLRQPYGLEVAAITELLAINEQTMRSPAARTSRPQTGRRVNQWPSGPSSTRLRSRRVWLRCR